MDVRILGPLEVRDGERAVPLRGGKERALLALLFVNANCTLAIDRIVDELWGESVPESAHKMVQIYVSRLRKALPEGVLRTRPPGYAVQLAPDELDAERFERLAAEARASLDAGLAEQASEWFSAALALWRGPALGEFTAEPFAAAEGARLEELRMRALEGRLEADLLLGRHGDLVPELETLIARHPLREGLRRQHLLALYRSGRQAEALAAYQEFRRTLAEELGIEPSAALRELERRMLQQDPSLEAPPRAEAVWRSPVAGAVNGGPADEVAYARSGDTRIAYQVVGDGPVDLVLVHGWVCTFQPGWEYPKLAEFYRRLASIGRLILFDKRGTGLSDRVSLECLPDLETRMDDVRAVLDAAGSERAVVIGISEGGPMSLLFAATHPARTVALVLLGAFAREMEAPDYPYGMSREELERRLALVEDDDWALETTQDWLSRVAPSVARDPAALRWYVSYVRRGASPGANRVLRLMNAEIDIRDVLPTIGVPTLVIHRAQESWHGGSRYLGEHIPGARLVELPGSDHLPWEGDADSSLDEIERFLAGIGDTEPPDRVLATLLVVDAAGATAKAAELGARAWNELDLNYRRLVRAELARFRGREVAASGEALVATFDGPARAIRCASAIVLSVRDLDLDTRAGVHTGEIEQTSTGIRGVALDIGAAVAAAARPGEVLVSSTVKDIVAGSGIAFEERGERELGELLGAWRLFAASA